MAPINVQQHLHFVTLSSYDSPSRDDQQSLRSFVMREHLRQKNDPKWKFMPASVSDDISAHVSRFRSANSSGFARPKKLRKPKDAKTTSTKLRDIVPATVKVAFDQDDSSMLFPVHDLDMLDPFQTFSIDLSRSETLDLLQYYHTSFWANSYACNPEGRWLSVALMDPAMIHATLSLVAIHRRDRTSFDLSKVYYKHRGEAMRIIVSRLSESDHAVNDATIGAVALLSSSDNNFDWNPEVQAYHIAALTKMISIRGGFESLATNRHIQTVAAWADLLHAATHSTKPSLEVPSSVSTAQRFDDDHSEDIENNYLPSYSHIIALQALPSEVAQIIRHLRTLTSTKRLLLSERNSARCRMFSDMLWQLEHDILMRQWESKSKAGTSPSRTQFWNRSMINAVGIAALILSYSTLRDLIAPSIFKKLNEQLKIYLIASSYELLPGDERTSTKVKRLDYFDDEDLNDGDDAILLWILCLGWSASSHDKGNRAWFATELARVCWENELLSCAELMNHVQSVVPYQPMSKSEDLWMDIEEILASEVLQFR